MSANEPLSGILNTFQDIHAEAQKKRKEKQFKNFKFLIICVIVPNLP